VLILGKKLTVVHLLPARSSVNSNSWPKYRRPKQGPATLVEGGSPVQYSSVLGLSQHRLCCEEV
jgi:hypothetical protein